MSDVGYVYLLSSCERRSIEAYSAWASALLVQLLRAMREPLRAGRVTSTDSRASFYAHDKAINQTPPPQGASGNTKLETEKWVKQCVALNVGTMSKATR